MAWLETLGIVASGGATGLIGMGVKIFADYKKEQKKAEHQLAIMAENRAQMVAELDLAKFRGDLQLEMVDRQSDSEGMLAAIAAEQNTGENTYKWVNALRGSTRPVLTFTLVIMAWVSPDEEQLTYMASTAVTFWFGDRPIKKKGS